VLVLRSMMFMSTLRQVNTFASRQLKYLNNASIAFHSLGVFAISVAVLAKAPTHQSAKFVFTTFVDRTGVDGASNWSERASPAYTAIIGCLMAQYTVRLSLFLIRFRPALTPIPFPVVQQDHWLRRVGTPGGGDDERLPVGSSGRAYLGRCKRRRE
jgi:hypothetical protein